MVTLPSLISSSKILYSIYGVCTQPSVSIITYILCILLPHNFHFPCLLILIINSLKVGQMSYFFCMLTHPKYMVVTSKIFACCLIWSSPLIGPGISETSLEYKKIESNLTPPEETLGDSLCFHFITRHKVSSFAF